MKNLLIILILLISCNNSNPADNGIGFKKIKEIDYTFDSGWKESYSIKINSNGACIVGDGRWKVNYFIGQLSEKDMQGLDSLVQNIPFNQYDSAYHEDAVDQASYKFVVINTNKDTVTKFVYGRKAPKLLNDFSNRLRQIKDGLHLVSKDTTVDFASRINFFPPAIKIP
jgi:hypothetical protein